MLKEEGQDQIVQWYNKEVGTIDTKLKFETAFIDITDEEADISKICDEFSDGITMMLDIRWSSNDAIKNFAMDLGIPYIEVDVSISPALLLLDKYLDFRNSTDVSLILDNPHYIDQALYYWIDSTRLRMLVSETLNKMTAKRLKQIRPSPNNFALIATTKNMNKLFKIALDEDLVSRPDRWNLVFLDFDYNNFDNVLLFNKSINILTLDTNICCNLLNLEESCQCPEKINLQEEFFKVVLATLAKIFGELSKDELKLINEVQCNTTTYDEQAKMHFEEIFENEMEKQKKIIKENSVIRIKVEGAVRIGTNESSELVAKYANNVMELQEGKKVEPIKPFYRVGITHIVTKYPKN